MSLRGGAPSAAAAAAVRAALGVLAAAAAAGCGEGDAPPAGAAPAAAPPPTVVVTTVVRRTVPLVAEYVGRTAADHEVELRARVEGTLEEALFEEGRPVAKGQVLFRIESDRYEANAEKARAALDKAQSDLLVAREQVSLLRARADLAQAKAQLVKAQQDTVRIRPLVEEKAVAAQELDAAVAAERSAEALVAAMEANVRNAEVSTAGYIRLAEAEVKAARAAVAEADLLLSYTTVTSPIDGVIGGQRVDVGNLVGRGESTLLATVSAVDPIRVRFSIPEETYLKLAARERAPDGGPPYELVLADGAPYAHPGRFLYAERALDATTGTLPVVVGFPNPDRVLRPELFGRVRIQLDERKDAVVVPQKALATLQGTRVVYVVGEGDVVSLRTVTPGERVGPDVVVLSGLEGGERIVLEGHQKVRPGSPVVPAAAATAEPSGTGK